MCTVLVSSTTQKKEIGNAGSNLRIIVEARKKNQETYILVLHREQTSHRRRNSLFQWFTLSLCVCADLTTDPGSADWG